MHYFNLIRHYILSYRLYQFTRANIKFVLTYKEFLILDFSSAGLTDLVINFFFITPVNINYNCF